MGFDFTPDSNLRQRHNSIFLNRLPMPKAPPPEPAPRVPKRASLNLPKNIKQIRMSKTRYKRMIKLTIEARARVKGRVGWV